jgi:hypothetical protein
MRLTTFLLAVPVFASCVTKTPPPSVLAEGCLLNSDCQSPLVCAFRRCHTACETSRDCPAGLHCRPADRPFNVCLLPDEIRCERDTDCVNAMTCGVDGICRSPCTSSLACLPEQLCVQGVCADGLELVNGALPVAIDAGFTCTRNSDCPVGELCARGVCIAECVNSRDCPVGATCVAGRCLGGRCALNSDCPPGQRCSPVGWCAPECVEPRDCPSGLVCLDNVCATPPVMRDGGVDGGAPDGGAPDAGASDGGAGDGGTGDAGRLDAGTCILNGDCGASQWCDQGACAPACTAGSCSGGRLCDTRLGVCVRACTQGCGAASVCDTSPDAGVDAGIGQCLAACDGTFRCALGQACRNGFCAPECLAASDCPSAHATCQRGQCVFDGTCDDDLDCPATEVCRFGACAARVTSLADAGTGLPPAFFCGDPCDCRLGEWCSGGRCLADALPTLYFARDGGGDGRSPASPAGNFFEALPDAGPGAVLALREGETWLRSTTLVLPSRTALGGGYKACSPTRWVRGDALTTTLSFTNAVLTTTGTNGSALRSLTLEGRGHNSGLRENALVMASNALGFTVEQVRGRILDPGTSNVGPGFVLGCDTCPNLTVRGLRLLTSGNPRAALAGLATLSNISGTLSHLRIDAQPPAPGLAFVGVGVNRTSGPLTLEDVSIDDVEERYRPVGVSVTACQNGAARLERVGLTWPTRPGDYYTAVSVADCAVQVRALDLTTGTGPLTQSTTGLSLARTSGLVEDVTVRLANGAGSLIGVVIGDPRGLTLRNVDVNVSGPGACLGIATDDASQGPLVFERVRSNVIGLGSPLAALRVRNVGAAVGLRVRDSYLEAASSGPSSCNANPVAAWIEGSSAHLERCRVRAHEGAGPVALSVDATSSLGLSASHAWVGRDTSSSTCTSTARPAALKLDGRAHLAASTLDGEGDAFQFQPTAAVLCGPMVSSLNVTSSILGGGRAQTPLVVSGPCPTTQWRSSYFWFDRPGAAPHAMDGVLQIVQADAGIFDVNGNAFAPNASCFEPAMPDAGPAYRLRASAACLDRGTFALREDGSPVLVDLDGRPRDGGTGPDIGCSER